MLTDWSAACGADDPVLVVPWSSPDGSMQWVDLREDPFAVNEIPEGEDYPALLAALRALNGARSAWFTAKCDVWDMDAEELEHTRNELLLEDEVAQAGLVSYIDLLPRDRTLFASRHRTEQVLYRLERAISELPYSLAAAELVMRPAVVELEGTVAEGFAVTLYVRGVGVDEQEAALRWDESLRAVAATLRSRDLLAS